MPVKFSTYNDYDTLTSRPLTDDGIDIRISKQLELLAPNFVLESIATTLYYDAFSWIAIYYNNRLKHPSEWKSLKSYVSASTSVSIYIPIAIPLDTYTLLIDNTPVTNSFGSSPSNETDFVNSIISAINSSTTSDKIKCKYQYIGTEHILFFETYPLDGDKWNFLPLRLIDSVGNNAAFWNVPSNTINQYQDRILRGGITKGDADQIKLPKLSTSASNNNTVDTVRTF